MIEGVAFKLDKDATQEQKVSQIQELIEEYRNQQAKKSSAENNPFVTTFGLCVHSIADGIALGCSLFFSSEAATVGEESNVGIVIFFAILMHKIPASIGLGTFLQRCSLATLWFNIYLCSFTLTSPVAAMASYGILKAVEFEQGDSKRTIGILLLLSAGTFLYVATMHILPSKGGHDHSNMGAEEDKNKRLREVYRSQGTDAEKQVQLT